MSVFGDYGVHIELNHSEDFLKIRETLTRIGIESFDPTKVGEKGKSLVQSCHILHLHGNYAIVHFKELFKMDGKDKFISNGQIKETIVSKDDIARRNAIAFLLERWGLLKIVSPEVYQDNKTPLSKIKIIPYREKHEWDLVSKHSLGRKK